MDKGTLLPCCGTQRVARLHHGHKHGEWTLNWNKRGLLRVDWAPPHPRLNLCEPKSGAPSRFTNSIPFGRSQHLIGWTLWKLCALKLVPTDHVQPYLSSCPLPRASRALRIDRIPSTNNLLQQVAVSTSLFFEARFQYLSDTPCAHLKCNFIVLHNSSSCVLFLS